MSLAPRDFTRNSFLGLAPPCKLLESFNAEIRIIDGAEDFAALNKWTDMEYLSKGFEGFSVEIHRLDRGWYSSHKEEI